MTPSRLLGIVLLGAAVAVAGVLAAPAYAAPASQETAAEESAGAQEAAQSPPDATAVLLSLRDVGIPVKGVRVRTTLLSDGTGSALVELDDGTLVDVQLAATGGGWTIRDIFYVAGSPQAFRSWTSAWQQRVASAREFLESQRQGAQGTRRAQELAPLVWFEDQEESSRLWGMNPVTYRLMQTLKMTPYLSGPMDRSGTERPR